MRAIAILGLAIALSSPAGGATQDFFFHHADTPVTVPGGTTNFFLDELAPTASAVTVEEISVIKNTTVAFPTFTATPFATDTLLGPLGVVFVYLSANLPMNGCADLSVTLERLDDAGRSATIGTGTLASQTVPQGAQSGTQGFAEFRIDLDIPGDRLVVGGGGIAVNVSVTNNCGVNRAVRLAYDAAAAPARAEFVALAEGAASCLRSVDRTMGRYLRQRMAAERKCNDKIDDGRLAPQDCLLEPKTATKLEKGAARAAKGILRKCTEGFVIQAPPGGIGAAVCPGLEGQCSFSFSQLDDGVRGNDNDYVDCLLCLFTQAADQLVGLEYATSAPRPLSADLAKCQVKIARAASRFASRKLALLQKCRKQRNRGKITGSCPDAKTVEKIAAAAAKVAKSLARRCTDAMITSAPPAGLGLDACPGPPAACQGPIAGLADLAACLRCTHEFKVDCIFPTTAGGSSPGCL